MALTALSDRQRRAVYAVILLPIIAVAGYVYLPAIAPPILVATSIGLAVAVEFLARSVHRNRTPVKLRRDIGVVVALGILVIAGTGVAVLRARTPLLDMIFLGAVVGGIAGGMTIAASVFAEDRPRLAQGIIVLIVVMMVVAGARAVGHLSGFAPAGPQAVLAAGGFLGLFVVLGFFGVKEII